MKNSPKILIVDDDPTNLRFLDEVLSDQFLVQSVSSGEEALERLHTYNPDLLLLDIMLPGMDGYEVCQEVRKSKHYENMKIILISAKAMADEKRKGYEAGGDAYITKPFNHIDLLEKIRQVIN
ncbi:response regulator [bacterium]|nr:response regulator [bacterium]